MKELYGLVSVRRRRSCKTVGGDVQHTAAALLTAKAHRVGYGLLRKGLPHTSVGHTRTVRPCMPCGSAAPHERRAHHKQLAQRTVASKARFYPYS